VKSSDAIALVRHLRLEGVSIWADQQGDIHIMPALLIPEDRALIRANKPAVVAYLRRYAADMLPDQATLDRWRQETTNGGRSTP
jgi:hypothetical protein